MRYPKIKQMAVVCAAGIGDSLIFSTLAHALRKAGVSVTVFSPHIQSFGSLLENGNYENYPENWEERLLSFDAILLQHEDTERAKSIRSLREKGSQIFTIYTNYHITKHGPVNPDFDFPVDSKKTLVENMQKAIQVFFGLRSDGTCSLVPLPKRSLKNNRILIHPKSTKEEKNWNLSKFLTLAEKLKKRGKEPHFIMSKDEAKDFPEKTLQFETLKELALAIYESELVIGNDSGPCHLASYLNIPNLVICQGRQMPLWKPGWHKNTLITPPKLIPNIKYFRLREKYWKKFISVKRALKQIK